MNGIGIVGFNVPIDTLYVISETILRVIWKIDPTNSVIAMNWRKTSLIERQWCTLKQVLPPVQTSKGYFLWRRAILISWGGAELLAEFDKA